MAEVEVGRAEHGRRGRAAPLSSLVQADGHYSIDLTSLVLGAEQRDAGSRPARFYVRLLQPCLVAIEREFSTLDFRPTGVADGREQWRHKVDLATARASELSGRVLDFDGRPACECAVGMFGPSTGGDAFELASATSTGRDGAFTIQVAGIGNYELLAAFPSRSVLRMTVQVERLGRHPIGDLFLSKGAEIQGQVLRTRSEVPWQPRVHLAVQDRFAQLRSYPNRFPTVCWMANGAVIPQLLLPLDDSGGFLAEGLGAVQYVVGIVRSDLPGVGPKCEAPACVTVLAPTHGIILQDESPLLVLEVVGIAGPVAGARVSYDENGASVSALTDAHGFVGFSPAPERSLVLTIEHGEYLDNSIAIKSPTLGKYDNHRVWMTPKIHGSLRVVASSQVTGRRLQTIQLRLKPVEGSAGLSIDRVSSDDLGAHLLEGVPVGTYAVRVLPHGPWNSFESYLAPSSQVVEIRNGSESRMRVELAGCGRIEVLLPPDDPPPDDHIRLLDAKGSLVVVDWVEVPPSFRSAIAAQERGRCYVIPGISEGEYTLQQEFDSGSTVHRLRVDTGATTRMDLIRH